MGSRDSMSRNGKLIVETANVAVVGCRACRFSGIQPGNYVMLRMTDTDLSMNKEVKQHIFEFFPTTRPVGEGTGLGLSASYGIIVHSDGNIHVDS